MEEIVNKLFENKRLNESEVGAFYFIGDKILSNSTNLSNGDSYGDFINYSSHWDLWRALCKTHPKLKNYEYSDFPRGRVIFNKKDRKFIIYLDPKLNKSEYIDKICREYRIGTNYEINDKDEHYDSLRYGNSSILEEDIIIREPLSNYVKLEVDYKHEEDIR